MEFEIAMALGKEQMDHHVFIVKKTTCRLLLVRNYLSFYYLENDMLFGTNNVCF